MRKRILGETVTPISGEWGSGDGEVKVLRSTNFTNEGHVDYAKIACREVEQDKVRRKRLSVGDVLIEKSGGSPTQPVGRVVYFESQGEFLTSNFLSALRVHDNEVHSKYLFYWLFSGYSRGLTKPFQNKTTGIINLQLKRFLKEIEFPLPPLEEQKRIAAILDEADRVRKKTQALIDKYDELAQSLFLDMFGDPGCNESTGFHELGEFCSQITDGDHATPKRESSGHKLLSCRNVKMNHLDFEAGLDFVGEEEFLRMSKRCLAESGDVLISCSGTIGRTLVVQGSEKFVMVRSAALVRVKSQLLDADYLARYLQTPYMQAVMKKRANASSQANLFIGQIKKLPLVLPEIEDQRKFGERIRKMEELKSDAQGVVQTETALFNALLQKAFKGELN